MIHGESRIESLVFSVSEETVSRVRPECKNAFFGSLLNGRKDYLLFFNVKQAVLTAVRIEPKDSYFGLYDIEIAFQGFIHQSEFLHDFLNGNSLRNFS